MTIKEVEHLTGISKANVRFYEAEGLLTPERKENGYRTYDESHVEILKRIKLFRAMDLSIDTIKGLSLGTITLPMALESRQEHFAQQHNQLNMAENVIRRMLESGETYESVDVDTYITMLEDEASASAGEDRNPRLNLPWRRFWARILDFSLYNLILFLLIPGIFGNRAWMLVRFGLALALFVTAETFLLALFGTTPGKAVFGISVTDLEGGRLTIRGALNRTVEVLQHGLGWNIPFLSQYVQWQSLKALENGQELSWEGESEVNFRDTAPWRYALLAVLVIPISLYPLVNGYTPELENQEQIGEQDPSAMESERDFYAMRNSYRVDQVLYSADGQYDVEELPIVVLDAGTLRFSHKGSSRYGKNMENAEEIGVFVRMQPEVDSNISYWELKSDSASDAHYQFRVEDHSVVLDYYEKADLQWSWLLADAEVLKVRLTSDHSEKTRWPGWWHEGTFEKRFVENFATHLHYPISMQLHFPEGEQPMNITIQEEFYIGETVTIREHTAVADENGILSFDIPLPELEDECCSVFYIPYQHGDFVMCFTYEPGKEAWDSFLYDL